MTDLAAEPAIRSSSTLWDANFQALHARFPKSHDSILFCLHELQQSDTVSLDDLKALANLHGIRITGASVAAARRLLAPRAPRPRRAAVAVEGDAGVGSRRAMDDVVRRDGRPEQAVRTDDSAPEQGGPVQQPESAAAGMTVVAAVPRTVRRPRVKRPEQEQNLGALVLDVVQRAVGDAEAEAERLRAAVRQAIEVLRASC
jgi:hypothetical protein